MSYTKTEDALAVELTDFNDLPVDAMVKDAEPTGSELNDLEPEHGEKDKNNSKEVEDEVPYLTIVEPFKETYYRSVKLPETSLEAYRTGRTFPLPDMSTLEGFSVEILSYDLVQNPVLGIAVIAQTSLGRPEIMYLHPHHQDYKEMRDLLIQEKKLATQSTGFFKKKPTWGVTGRYWRDSKSPKYFIETFRRL